MASNNKTGNSMASCLGLADFIETEIFNTILKVNNKIVLFVTGNRYGKTRTLTRKVVYGIMGVCPNPEHNIRPGDTCRTIRMGAELLPGDSVNEIRNTVYPQLKYQLPDYFIKKDITMRNPVIAVSPGLGGESAFVEFVSYGQSTQAQAGVDRKMIVIDELCPYDFYEESLPRLATTNGQFLAGLTPVEAGWMHTEIYERAKIYIKTKSVIDFLKKQYGINAKTIERTDSKQDICVIQASSDDNPYFARMVEMKKKDIEIGIITKDDFPFETVGEFLDSVFIYDDPDTIAMRRYGIFRQITGAVHKEFSWQDHVISREKYFPDGIPKNWKFARSIDYHQSVPWAMVWMAISPDDEAFVWEEMNPDPHTWTTLGICMEMMSKGKDYAYRVNLIDKLASEKQTNTNTSTTEDINRILRDNGKLAYDKDSPFESWDDKTTKGEDKVRERLINSKTCGKPFNNMKKVYGVEKNIPTLWILDNCRQTALSLKNWKMESWLERDSIVTKDPKDKKENKWSHFNKCIEAILKDARFRASPYEYSFNRDITDPKRYFRGIHRA